MQLTELQKFLQTQIPLVETLGARIVQADENSAELHVPLEPNRNHLGTAFGGSAYSVAVLACYTWLFNILQNKKLNVHVVIKNGQMKYLRPVTSDFASVCTAPEDIGKFLLILERKKKAQIVLRSEIRMGSDVACVFEGEFVAVL